MIKELLKKLGFGEKEIEVYLTILKHGKISPAHIARLTGIKRPTVYSITKELLEKEVIVEDLASKQSFFIALPPEDLKNLIHVEERKLQAKKHLISKAVQELQGYTRDVKYSIPKIQFVYEEDLEKFLYKQAALWNESVMKDDKTWWGFQDPDFVKQYQAWIDWYWTKAVPPGLTLQLLSNQSPVEVEMANKGYIQRIIKFWKNTNNVTATTWVCGDYLIMIMTSKNPHYLVQIHDRVLAHNMREMFKTIWHSI
jgi:hypothetical protein